MILFRTLVHRATVPFQLILAVKWLQDSNLNLHGMLFLVIYSFSCLCLFSSYSKPNTRLTNIQTTITVIHISSMFIFLRKMRADISETFFDDLVLPFLNYRSLYDTALRNIIYITSGTYKLYRRLGITNLQIVGYLSWLLFHSIILIWVLECVITMTITSAVVVMSKNIINTFDANNTFDYPEGYLTYKNIEHTEFRKSFYVTDIYRSEHGKTSFVSSFTTSQQVHPLSHRLIKRYVGEDVEIDCTHLSTNNIRKLRYVWFYNNTRLKKVFRYKFAPISEEENVDSIYKRRINVKLHIELLRKEDFGDYECAEEETYDHGPDVTIIRRTLYAYRLSVIERKPELIYRTVGSLMASQDFFWYHTNADVDDISIIYTINDESLENTCPGLDTHVCIYSAKFIASMLNLGVENLDWDGQSAFPFLSVGGFDNLNIKRAIIYFCICDKAFGMHKVSFSRRYFNERINSYQIEEFQHPFTFVILPETSIPWLSPWLQWQDDVKIYNNLVDFIEKENSTEAIGEEVLRVAKYISLSEKRKLFMANIIETFTVLIGFYLWINCIGFGVRAYVSFFNVQAVRFLANRGIQHQVNLAIDNGVPYIFISHSEEQNELILNVLLPCLEQQCNRNVLSAHRDCRPGKSIIRSLVENIKCSKHVIVILSDSYMEEPSCYNLQLDHLILPMLYENQLSLKDVLFIKYAFTGTIPDVLRWNMDVCVLTWNPALSNDVQLQRIKQWLVTGDTDW